MRSQAVDTHSTQPFAVTMHVDPPALSRPSQLHVHSIHLKYTWRATQEDAGLLFCIACLPLANYDFAEPHIFSTHLLLPDASVLDALFQRFVTNHLVSRYPLIFGPWCRRFAAERKVFPSIARSVLAVAVRSPNPSMRKSTRKLIVRMRTLHELELELTNSRLNALVPPSDDAPDSVCEDTLSDMKAITFALERLYRRAIKPRRFKVRSGSLLLPQGI